MFTFSFIKHTAKTADKDDIKHGKVFADTYMNYSLWWAFDCVDMYQRFCRTTDKVFWWKMVVKTLRYANDCPRLRGSGLK